MIFARHASSAIRIGGGRLGLAVVAALALAACAGQQAERAQLARTALVGLPKADLLACAGVPERSAVSGDTEYLTYLRHQTTVRRDVDYEEEPWLRRLGIRAVRPEVSYHRLDYSCEATFVLRDGVVSRLDYNQGRDITLCHAIVANCLPPAE